ncbi:MAG: 1-deoxy-D-xylulose-5-phosphate reductoisomerase [Rhodobacteraceae bacterium]|uniref:1-deoxy-D-xylulose-5-phosphate reductoisomerase n=1 Tax=Amaricoccus sp. B4 TaxID=3368557 RepID=UPI000DAC20A9|nr:1-deoxy-D-xylulose-5-phosphate reductoisomerase [Paracoccaceae bacterium]
MRRRISIFGSTGSIGQNTVSLIEDQGGAETHEVVALTGARNIRLLAAQARKLRARIAVTSDPTRLAELRAALEGSGIEAAAGPAAIADAASEPVDWAMSAIVGAAGLVPGLRAAESGGIVALANKESLVCAGALFLATCARHGATLLPVDSEHSAIFQALNGERHDAIERIILTASGGPFRDWPREAMARVTPAQAMAHPNWDMGQRISIDSASMFNKALEIIEAHVLFGVPSERIEVVVHPQSIIHSLVGFRDGSIMAHLGPSDMRGAIGYALNWPVREPLPLDRLDLAALARLDFCAADPERFPALRLAHEVMELGGLAGAVFNAAKEAALDGFLAGAIGFLDMSVLVEHVTRDLGREAASCGSEYSLADVLELDRRARVAGRAWIETCVGA